MLNCRLTKKKMANKRFNKIEILIITAHFRHEDCRIVKKIAEYAGISRSTIYRHHQSIETIPQDLEEYLFEVYTSQIEKYLKKAQNLSIIFLRSLTFISSNKLVFQVLFKDGRKEIIKKMLSHLKVVVVAHWGISGKYDKAYNIYQNEVLGTIEFWSERNFSTKFIEKVYKDILYLTETAPEHLAPLVDR